MGRVTDRRMMTRVDLDRGTVRRTDTVAVEEPLEIRLDGRAWTVTMRTPGHDVELAHGLLHGEGIIDGRDDVMTARYCADTDTLNVLDLALTDPGGTDGLQQRSTVMYGGCGLCGKSSIEAVERSRPTLRPVAGAPVVAAETLAGLPASLREHQQVFDRTGGVHAAGLFTPDGNPLVVREDIGRHNAVDKAIGWALISEHRCTQDVLAVSSRGSFEIVQKAAMATIPIVVCVSAASSLAIDAAHEFGITLICFARGRTLSICSHPERVELPPAA